MSAIQLLSFDAVVDYLYSIKDNFSNWYWFKSSTPQRGDIDYWPMSPNDKTIRISQKDLDRIYDEIKNNIESGVSDAYDSESHWYTNPWIIGIGIGIIILCTAGYIYKEDLIQLLKEVDDSRKPGSGGSSTSNGEETTNIAGTSKGKGTLSGNTTENTKLEEVGSSSKFPKKSFDKLNSNCNASSSSSIGTCNSNGDIQLRDIRTYKDKSIENIFPEGFAASVVENLRNPSNPMDRGIEYPSLHHTGINSPSLSFESPSLSSDTTPTNSPRLGMSSQFLTNIKPEPSLFGNNNNTNVPTTPSNIKDVKEVTIK